MDNSENPKEDEEATTSKSEGKTKKTENRLKYECKICDYKAEFPNRLREHMKIRHNEKIRYRCVVEDCKEGFKNYQDVRKHLKEAHPILHNCALCSYQNKTKAAVKKHMILNHKNGIPCTVMGCGIKVAKNRLRRHIREEHCDDKKQKKIMTMEKGEIKCPYCEYQPDESKNTIELQREDLNLHVENIHRTGIKCPLKCGKCLKIEELDDHLTKEHAEETSEVLDSGIISESIITSSQGSETSNTTRNLKELEEEEEKLEETGTTDDNKREKIEKEEMNVCSFCEKKYANKNSLRKHVKTVHEKTYSTTSSKSREKRFKCDFEMEDGKTCEKSFTTTGLLEDHTNWHKGLKPFKCNTCDQSFFARARFAVHLQKYHQTSIKTLNFVDRNI